MAVPRFAPLFVFMHAACVTTPTTEKSRMMSSTCSKTYVSGAILLMDDPQSHPAETTGLQQQQRTLRHDELRQIT
jgi:hypothetical protein